MSSKKVGTLWRAEPHTIAKIAILEAYLLPWFQIFGRSRQGRDLLYVDGFSGPGEYVNHPKGSPLSALEAAKMALQLTGGNWKAGRIHCAFVEPDRRRMAHLRELLRPYADVRGIQIHFYESSFEEGLAALRREMQSPFMGRDPLFVFIDPFGAKGAPFATIASILSSPCSEVLINLDVDGIIRIYKAREDANYEAILDTVFGTTLWRKISFEKKTSSDRCREVLDFYQERLRRIPNVRYVFPFEMQTRKGAIDYFLVFASQHHLGLEKMKEAMKRMDQAGDYRFCDASQNQSLLFRLDQPSAYAEQMLRQFSGKRASYDELRDYALNWTPFVNPKSMLKHLEEQKLIIVQQNDPKRRPGTFSEDKITYIQFIGEKDLGKKNKDRMD
jgi:three-Cys-motif partner protein